MGSDMLATYQEQGARLLEQGEQVIAAFQARPRGAGVASAPGGAARAIGRAWNNDSARDARTAGLELSNPMVLALTDRRLVVFGGEAKGATGKIQQLDRLVSSVPLGEIESINVKRLLVGKSVHITTNGGEFKLEVPAGHDPRPLAERFAQTKG